MSLGYIQYTLKDIYILKTKKKRIDISFKRPTLGCLEPSDSKKKNTNIKLLCRTLKEHLKEHN
jgi:hypothetical protein